MSHPGSTTGKERRLGGGRQAPGHLQAESLNSTVFLLLGPVPEGLDLVTLFWVCSGLCLWVLG